MSDSFKEVTSVSLFGRLKRSVVGLIVGLILVVGMVVLLFWNEGRAVTTSRSLAEGASAVISVEAGAVDPANAGKLVHVTGPVTTSETPTDAGFGISAPGIRLVRSTEMYQWKEESKSETVKKLGGGEETTTTYSYAKAWDDAAIDSSNFRRPDGHTNPPMEIRGASFQVSSGKLAAFDLDGPVLSRISGEKVLTISPDRAAAIRAAYSGTAKLSIVNGRIYLGDNSGSPKIGDYRIAYEIVPTGEFSIVGRQTGTHFDAYPTLAGDQLLMVRAGALAADKMFADAVSENTVITWIIRIVGLVLLCIGFGLFLAPVGILADIIPFVGSIVRFGTGLVAVVLGVLVGSATIAFAWFWYRPLLALAIFGGGAVLAYVLVAMRNSRRKGAIAAAPAVPSAEPRIPADARAPAEPVPAAPSPAPQEPAPQGKRGKIAW